MVKLAVYLVKLCLLRSVPHIHKIDFPCFVKGKHLSVPTADQLRRQLGVSCHFKQYYTKSGVDVLPMTSNLALNLHLIHLWEE